MWGVNNSIQIPNHDFHMEPFFQIQIWMNEAFVKSTYLQRNIYLSIMELLNWTKLKIVVFL